ncbi:MAG TPA: DHH family phosphoesterase [Lentimicrobium sp.]|nr:DHH family phosphoesterase [Lentimicrobium sp.]
MLKRWVVRPKGDPEKVGTLAAELNVSEVIAELLVQRGITTYSEAKTFFRPDLDQLHDPFLMKDMDVAVERILNAINHKEKILVYGDYDVDGTTAVALIYTFLLETGVDPLLVDFYIPDRYQEGYGISIQSIDFAKENGFRLVIALDCGIKAVEKIRYANELKVDFIICDHHRPGEHIPDAVAVLDPKRADCPYPYKELSGCGVGFKLIQALAIKKNIPFSSLTKYLDLVTVSIASDIVPITGENRILAFYGLKLLNSKPKACFEAILKYANITRNHLIPNPSPKGEGLNQQENGNYLTQSHLTLNPSPKGEGLQPQNHLTPNPSPKGEGLQSQGGFVNEELYFCRELTISDLVFLIGPRINAAGRIESGRNAVKLLICDTMENAAVLAGQIDEFNTTRRDLDLNTTDMALDNIKNLSRLKNSKSTVVFNKEWHKGVIGIVASRLIETYYRPTIVLTQSNGFITGSARSVKDFDIYDAIDECSDLLEHFGGHKYAAGLSMKPENLDAFIEKFENVVASRITQEMLTPEIEIDLKLTLNEINLKLFRIIKQFAPFGPGNPSPVFQTDGVIDNGNCRVLKNKHLKLTIGHMDYASSPISAIAFQMGDFYDHIIKGLPFNICYHIEENDWNNKKEIQLNIKEIQTVRQVETQSDESVLYQEN